MIRVGLGYDVHRLVPGRPLILGGIEIPFDHGLEGHSDADVVLHAIADAILGAAGHGDIGEHFPPSDPRWKGADSSDLLRRVLEIVGTRWTIGNVDIVIIAEEPKIGPYRTRMVAKIAEVLDVEPEQVNVKATTNEQLGFAGRGEGIASFCVALLEDAVVRHNNGGV